MMRKVFVTTMITAMLIFSVALVGATTIPLGTITGGSGTATAPDGPPYSLSGTFLFDTTNYGSGSWADVFGDHAFKFVANSAGTPAVDYNFSVPGSPISRGDKQWTIENYPSVAGGDSRLYGSIGGFLFTSDLSGTSGTVTGTLNTDGFIHWYYGYDDTLVDPVSGKPGKTALASWTLSDTLTFAGTWSGTPERFTLTSGTVYASTVPIPGAVWLLGSGIVGLIGLKRRTNKRDKSVS